MFLIGKIAQAAGLGIILLGFIQQFPKLMNPRIFMFGLAVFMAGWIIERFLLKR